MTDEKIIELFFRREEGAIQETSKKYGSYCYSIAYNILNNHEDSEECVNDTWLATWDAIPPTRPSRLRLFLARIVRNFSFNTYKAKHRKKRGNGEIPLVLDELGECVSGNGNVEEEVIEKELQQSLNDFVRGLSVRDCNMFVRRYFYAESVKEIAKRYHCTENCVSVVLNRCRKKLKAHLKREGYEV